MTALVAERLTKRYGGLVACDRVDLVAEAGRVTALIGPNGAGKSTLFSCLAGAERPDEGRVLLGGRDVTALAPEDRARRGLTRTFQKLAVFPTMTVTDNLRVGAESRRPGSLLRGLLSVADPTEADDRARVDEVLELLGLAEVAGRRAAELPTGTLRLVELGRALCGRPSVLLLDEPASGLDTRETAAMQQVLRQVAGTGVAVVLVEHDMELVFGLADTVYALAQGRVLASGPPAEVRADTAVRSAYLDVVA